MRPPSLPVGYTTHVYLDYDAGFWRRWTWETVHHNPQFLGFGRTLTKQGARRAATRAARTNHRRTP